MLPMAARRAEASAGEDTLHLAHVKATFNNTIVTITNHRGAFRGVSVLLTTRHGVGEGALL